MRLKNLLKDKFLKNVSLIAVGTGISQLIALIISPIIAKLYSPFDLGVFATFFSIAVIISSVAAGRYEIAIPSVVDKEEAVNLIAVAFIFTIVTTVSLFILIFLFYDFIKHFANMDSLGMLVYLLPLSVFTLSVFNILTFANNRQGYYKDIAISNIIRSSFLSGFQILFGVFKTGFSGLIFSQIISGLSGNVRLLKNIRNDFNIISISKIKEVGYKYSKFLVLSSPGAFVDSLSLNIIHILNTKAFGFEVAGFFYFSYRIFTLPLSLVGNSISQVFYRELSFNRKNAKRVFFSTFKILLIVSILILIAEMLFLEFFWDFIFGSKWDISKMIGYYLAFSTIFQLLVSPLSTALLVANSIGQLTSWQFLNLFSIVSIYTIAIYLSMDIKSFMFMFMFTYLVLYLIYFVLIYLSINQISCGD